MNYSFTDINRIYNTLDDEISKKLFIAWFNYSITGNSTYIINVPSKYKNIDADTKILQEKIISITDKKVIFGAGNCGKELASIFHSIGFSAFIDNYRTDKFDEKTKLPIYSLDEYIGDFGVTNTCFIISIMNNDASIQIRNQLLEAGVLEKDIIRVQKDWRNNESQYFDVFSPCENEVFIDCGCFNGATAFRFAAWCGELSYSKIICFEPDSGLYDKCSKALVKLSDCSLHKYGVSDKYGKVSFLADGTESARIVNNSSSFDEEKIQSINTVDLDTFLAGERVTFIKMDIEGAEYDALVGASNIIKEQKPRMAICLYHNYEHIVSIPLLLLNLRSDYKFKIRQYSMLTNETVLYAY